MTPYSHLLRRSFTSSAIQRTTKLVDDFRKNTQDPCFRRKSSYYVYTVRELTKAKAFGLIEEILDEQKKYDDITDESFAVRLISLYGISGLFHRARHLFDEMPELNCVRTVKAFNALLAACVSAKQFDKIDGIFRDLVEKVGVKPDVVSYNTLIKGLCEAGSLDLAASVVDEMVKEGVKPNTVTFNTLIDALYKKRRFVHGDTMWGRMGKYNVVPDIVSYNTRLLGFVLQGRVRKAIELVEEIKKVELEPNAFTFNILFKGLCSDDRYFEEAKSLYSSMVKTKCEPNIATIATLLPFACHNDDFHFGAQLCRKMFKCKFLLKDVKLVQKVIDGLVKQADVDEAKLLVQLGMDSKHSSYHNLKMPELGK